MPTDTTTLTLNYCGDPTGAHMLVSELERAGVSVEWAPPMERRGGVVMDVFVGIVATGSYEAIKASVTKIRHVFRERGADGTIDGD